MRTTSILAILFIISLVEMQAHGVVLTKNNQQILHLTDSKVDVQIDNQIAIITTQQSFVNQYATSVLIDYGFPLRQGASPIGLRWRVGDGAWNEAVVDSDAQNTTSPNTGGGNGAGSTTSLDKYLGSNPLFFEPSDVIPSGELIIIELVYVELLEYTLGQVNFEYPSEYSLVQADPIDNFLFELNYKSDRTLVDLNHNIDNSEVLSAPTELIISAEETSAALDANINIDFMVSLDELGVFDLSTMVPDNSIACSPDTNGYFSLIIEPPSDEEAEILGKNFTLVIDRSGSMRGEKMDQAKSAASFIVNNLNDGDFFNIISFSSSVSTLFDDHEEISPARLEESLAFIDILSPSGSTNISSSLTTAISDFDAIQEDKVNIIIFFTDGLATSGEVETEGIVTLVDEQIITNETEVFLFTFGIGDDVDKQLLTLLGQENNGLATFLENEDLEESITTFFLRVNNPILIGTELSFEPADAVTDLNPSLGNLPNLYKGEQLIISGKYKSPQDVSMTLTGTAFNQDVNLNFEFNLADTIIAERSFLPKLWAKQKIDELSIQFNLSDDDAAKNSIQQEIDEVSQCFNVVSLDFNSFVSGVSLGIELVDFTGSLRKNRVHLSWTTWGEWNNDRFEIERSSDLTNWEKIGEKQGAGSSLEKIQYSFLDDNPLDGINYYRLKQVDIDGEATYSDVIAIILEVAENFKLITNLIARGQALELDNPNHQKLDIYLVDMNGRLVSRIQEYNHPIRLSTLDLAPGDYILHVTGEERRLTEKVTVF